METGGAVEILSALGQATRLEAFRLLVRAEPQGMAAGDVAATVAVPRNTMSTHLGILEKAGLVRSERLSRQIIYRANLALLVDLTTFLVEDCCDGRPELCVPVLADLPVKSSCG